MSDLSNNGYQIVKQFIEPERAQRLSNSFRDFCISKNVEGDSQVPTSCSYYNYIKFVQLLVEKIPHINSILGEPVLPTYAYSRWYKKGSILHKHTDRDECEVSVTINLSCDVVWPMYMQAPGKEPACLIIGPGDAAVYFGPSVPHWREEFAGNVCVQAFLHYVRSRGNNSHLVFDNYEHRKLFQERMKNIS